MAKTLQVIQGPNRGTVFMVPERDTLLIGRSRATETRLTDPHVSRIHCQIQAEGKKVWVLDFDSASGTFVNGTRVKRPSLKQGDRIRIGRSELQYMTDEPEEPSTMRSDAPLHV